MHYWRHYPGYSILVSTSHSRIAQIRQEAYTSCSLAMMLVGRIVAGFAVGLLSMSGG